jgi:hypothetical protein
LAVAGEGGVDTPDLERRPVEMRRSNRALEGQCEAPDVFRVSQFSSSAKEKAGRKALPNSLTTIRWS